MILVAVSVPAAGRRRPDDGHGAGPRWSCPLSPRGWVIFVLCVVAAVPPGLGLQCGPCEPAQCPVPAGCPGGLVLDPCGCCSECARQLNKSCGGAYGTLGRCDVGLTCTISPDPGSPITDHKAAEGLCAESPEVQPQELCDPSKCEPSPKVSCPNETVAVLGNPTPGACCPPPPHCVCKPCDSQMPQCHGNLLPALVAKGAGLPGNCCDVYECQDKSIVCANVTCDGAPEVACTPDSQPLPALITQGGCCSQPQGCTCKPKGSCVSLTCPGGQRLQFIAPATDIPGSCCDQQKCVNDSSQSCMYESVAFQDGEKWQPEECITCYCQSKLVFCSAIKCDTAPPPSCGWLGLEDGQCCPICKGCIGTDGSRYENDQEWDQDECIRCRCEEGSRFCQASQCIIRCAHPRRVPGRCCPVCDEVTMITIPPDCPPLDNCTLSCVTGLRKDEKGCYICQCNPEIVEKCPLDCPMGYKLDEDGQKLCECFDDPRPTTKCPSLHRCQKHCEWGYKMKPNGCWRCRCNKCPPFLCKKKCIHGYVHEKGCKQCRCQHPAPPTSIAMTTFLPPGHSCMSLDGHFMQDGEMWYDGCRRCFCYEGHEWCSLITCPPLTCRNPVMRPGDCCPTCPEDESISVAPGLPTKCQESGGTVRSEGETWLLDACTQCICHAGGILCQIESCPPLLCHHPVRLRSTCCLVCPEGSGPFRLPAVQSARSCTTSGGTKFSDGDTWRVNACQSCVCRHGQVHCFSQTCPLLTCNRTLLKKGQCCPFCVDDRASSTCIHNGQVYKADESWLIETCTRCECIRGVSVCSSLQCPTPPCLHPVRIPGLCCTICTSNNTTLDSAPPGVGHVPPLIKPNQSQPRPPTDGGDDVPKEEGRQFPIAYTVLITVVVLLILVVILLLILLMRTRRKTDSPLASPKVIPKVTEVMMATSDQKIGPKSTNVELQGLTPLPNGMVPLASVKPLLQKGEGHVCTGAVPVILRNGHGVKSGNMDKVSNMWPNQDVGDKTYRYSSADDKTVNTTLDVPDDVNSYRKSM